ncbi:metallophosphoesterase [Nannocystis pusilla]|uniref:metallophosphoesterase n=1 Tax=Nannocystis pusilla TaxID=889268 RepID=UPI003B7DF5E5
MFLRGLRLGAPASERATGRTPGGGRGANPASPSPATTAPAPAPTTTRLPAPARLVALGDLHGDFEATRAALRLAGAIDPQDKWIGKELMVVQTGDQLDRGDGERKILELLERLQTEARAAGGPCTC